EIGPLALYEKILEPHVNRIGKWSDQPPGDPPEQASHTLALDLLDLELFLSDNSHASPPNPSIMTSYAASSSNLSKHDALVFMGRPQRRPSSASSRFRSSGMPSMSAPDRDRSR